MGIKGQGKNEREVKERRKLYENASFCVLNAGGNGNGNDNQLRLNACMLAPAPPQPDSPKVGEDYVLNGQS